LGHAIPFSDVDEYFNSIDKLAGCIADTSFLIALSDKEHPFFDDAQFLFEKLVEYKVPIFVTVTIRSEFIDFHRRVKVTEALMDMLAPASKWKTSATVRDALRSQRGWLDNQARDGQLPYLTDQRIKKCKQVFLPKTHSGHIGWLELCREFLAGQLQHEWDHAQQMLGINYIDASAAESAVLFRKELRWGRMCELSEASALGSSDAMILNLLDCSVLPFIVTADFDLAYGIMASLKDRLALVPDAIFRRHIKRLNY